MATVVVLGGCGAVGRVAVQTLAADDTFDRVVVADINLSRAQALAAQIGGPKVSAVPVDAADGTRVHQVVVGSDVVLNCTGPFYRYVRTVFDAVQAARVAYVDVCDDVDVTLDLLNRDDEVRAAGGKALIGMGSSPGVTNILARLANDLLLDTLESIDIFHAHGGEPFEGPGVVAHRFHCMSMDIPMFLDGQLKRVRFFEQDGLALRDRVDLLHVGPATPVYPYPHPEQITIPRFLKLQRVTNRGTVLPDAYYELTMEMARLGLGQCEPLTVAGQPVVPRDFAIAWLLKRRDEILQSTDFGVQRGCVKVVAAGTRHDRPRMYVFSMASQGQALGEGTGIPAALGAILMQQGQIRQTGVRPPEGCVEPLAFLALVRPVLARMGGKGAAFDGFVIERSDDGGRLERVDLPI